MFFFSGCLINRPSRSTLLQYGSKASRNFFCCSFFTLLFLDSTAFDWWLVCIFFSSLCRVSHFLSFNSQHQNVLIFNFFFLSKFYETSMKHQNINRNSHSSLYPPINLFTDDFCNTSITFIRLLYVVPFDDIDKYVCE